MLYCLGICSSHLKVMIQGTIRNDVFFAQQGIAMLEQCCNHLNPNRNNIATLYCAKKSLLRSHDCRFQFVFDNQASYASLFAMKVEPWVIQICLLSLIISNDTNNKNRIWKTATFFKNHVHPCLPLYLLCCLYLLFFNVSLNLVTIPNDCIEIHFVSHPL